VPGTNAIKVIHIINIINIVITSSQPPAREGTKVTREDHLWCTFSKEGLGEEGECPSSAR